MSGLMRLNSRAYGAVLLLYPAELRRDFGMEMRELFGEDLADAWRSSGVAGVLRVWWCAVCEILRIAIPGQIENPAFAVPVIAFAFNVLTLSCEWAAMITSHPSVQQGRAADDMFLYVFWPSLVTAITAIVVVHTGKVNMFCLKLDSAGDGTPCSKSAI
jgi:hypothetical protein